jgi:Cyclin, C-terminal domain
MSKLSQFLYSKHQFEQMERCILSALEWRMNPPTAHDFVQQFVNLIPSSATVTDDATDNFVERIVQLASTRIEMALQESPFDASYKPSTVAAYSLLYSIGCLQQQDSTVSTELSLLYHDTKLLQDVTQTIASVAGIIH